MTTGQLVFSAGVALLLATIVLAVVFAVKKPQYTPETAVGKFCDNQTAALRSGYPTDRLTQRRQPAAPETVLLPAEEMAFSAPSALSPETVLLETEDNATDLLE